jgi:uncharacterized repeat protein (TIGR01451 family)
MTLSRSRPVARRLTTAAAYATAAVVALTAPFTASAGALKLHTANPRYLQDSVTGKAVLITGYPNLVPTVNDPAEPNFPTYTQQIDDMFTNQVTYTRVWHQISGRPLNASFWPWKKARPVELSDCYLPEENVAKWNLAVTPDGSNFKDEYWNDRMRLSLAYATSKNIVAEVLLFDRSSMEGGSDGKNWNRNPWNSGNHTLPGDPRPNWGTPGCGPSGVPGFYTSGAAVAGGPMEAYVAKMIEISSDLNVIYEIENESVAEDTAWPKKWAPFIKARVPARLVSFSAAPGNLALLDGILQSSDPDLALIDIINYHPGQGATSDAIGTWIRNNWSYARAINVDEFANGETNPATLRALVWTIITSGGHFHIEDVASTLDPYPILKNVNAFLASQFGSTHAGWEFVYSKPNASLSAEKTCMSPISPTAAQDYLCYATNSSAGVTLRQVPAGRYAITWWNPRAVGGWASAPSYIAHPGGDLTSGPPPSGMGGPDWVLLARNESSDVAVTVDDGAALVLPGRQVKYTITVSNRGPVAVSGAHLSDVFPAELADVEWKREPNGTLQSGNVSLDLNLEAHESVVVTATAQLVSGTGLLSNTATVSFAGDTDPSNNTSTDVDRIAGEAMALRYHKLAPCRLVDTRNTNGPILAAEGIRAFTVHGVCGIPIGAAAISVNVTAVGPNGDGFLTLFPTGSATPRVSTVNFMNGVLATGNATITPLGAAEKALSVYARVSNTSGTVHMVADVTGYFDNNPGGLAYHTMTPCRLVDTRASTSTIPATGDGESNPCPAAGCNGNGGVKLDGPILTPRTWGIPESWSVVSSWNAQGLCGVPVGAEAVAVNLTVAGPSDAGDMTLVPSGTALTKASSLNFAAGEVRGNSAIASLGASGSEDLSLSTYIRPNGTTAGTAHAIIDAMGYLDSEPGLVYHPVPPCRLVDTRRSTSTLPATAEGASNDCPPEGCNGNGGAMLQGPTKTPRTWGDWASWSVVSPWYAQGLCGVPVGAKAVVVNLTSVGPSNAGDMTLFPSAGGVPRVSSLNFPANSNEARGNGSIVPLGPSGSKDLSLGTYIIPTGATPGTGHAVIDVTGYFK